MKKSFSLTTFLGAAVLSLIALVMFTTTLSAYADIRDSGRTRSTGSITPPPASIVPSLNPPASPAPQSGGITSTTEGSVHSGGNQGGHVVTGNESVEVHEVNVGPTNPPPLEDPELVEGPPAPAPAPDCDGRSRTGCTDTPARGR